MIDMKRPVLVAIVLAGGTALTLGIGLLASGRSEDAAPLPRPYGLQCPARDMIADVDIDQFFSEAAGAPTPIEALSKGVITEESGLMSAQVRRNPNRASGAEVEFFFEHEDGSRIGRATVERVDGNWYVTRYTACSSAQ